MKVLYKLIPYELQGKEITKISNESTTTVFCTHKKPTIDGKKKPSQRYLKGITITVTIDVLKKYAS